MSFTATLRPAPSAALSFTTPSSASTCPNCGTGIAGEHADGPDAQRRIAELEGQVKILTGKATAAVDRLADYEDELRQLKSAQSKASAPAGVERATTPTPETGGLPLRSTTPTSPLPTALTTTTRLSSFLTARKAALPQPPSTPSTSDLEAALTRESRLREAAEGKLSQASGELEELSTELFAQANEMVAAERKARAKLEERVAVLERRDGEKRARLERLEGAVKRVERVRGLLSTDSAR
ncbi:MAG: hypothetical protein M1832_003458 [Thelocarpon impressellum]|nr:MAG: hypothetical protein M1832_003458 [Thelocarpon impressellum]